MWRMVQMLVRLVPLLPLLLAAITAPWHRLLLLAKRYWPYLLAFALGASTAALTLDYFGYLDVGTKVVPGETHQDQGRQGPWPVRPLRPGW